MKRHKSFVIAIEGIDSAGKHTLATKLTEHLDSNKSSFTHKGNIIGSVELYSFPDYNSLCGQLLKDMLNTPDPDPRKIAALFALDRKIQGIGEDEYGNIKVLDRYYPSNFAYQSDLDLDYLMSIEKDSYIPNVTFILDLPVDETFERRNERRDEYEKNKNKLYKVRNNYLHLAHKFGWVVLDASRNKPEEILEYIMMHIFYRMADGLTNKFHEDEFS